MVETARKPVSLPRGKKSPTNKESRKALVRAVQNLAEQNLGLLQKVQTLEKKLDVLYQNQQELVRSENRLDEQFCVSTRLMVLWINHIIRGARSKGETWAEQMNVVTYEKVNELFHDFAKFRARPDFRNHMREWFMGEPVDSLPEVREDDGRSDVGDKADSEAGPEGGEHGQEDPVPVREQDAAETESPRP